MSKVKRPKIKVFGEKFQDLTEEFFNVLHFDPEEVWQGADRNRIKTMPSILLGTTGVGKSTYTEWMLAKINEWYSKNGILATYTNQVSLTEFLIWSMKVPKYFNMKNTPAVFNLVFDDATAVEVKPKEIKQFFSIRHYIEQELGVKEGIVYTTFVTHDFYSLSKIFRRYAENLVVLSVPPLDVYSRRHLESLLGEGAMKVLQTIYKKAMKFDKYKGTGFVRLPFIPDNYDSEVGIVKFKPVNVKSVQIKYGDSSNVIIDHENGIMYIPQSDEASIAESEEDALARLERKRKQNNEAVARYRERQAKLVKSVLTKRSKTIIHEVIAPV